MCKEEGPVLAGFNTGVFKIRWIKIVLNFAVLYIKQHWGRRRGGRVMVAVL